jgi:intracellular sulfur oxidation DsrE/DsrF family protein
MKFRLADRTFYTPDFNVMLSNFEMEMHEVKGFMEDDAAVKIKVVAEIYPFRFFLAHRVRKQWDIKEV